MSETIDRFIPKTKAEVSKRHETTILAPAPLLFEVAEPFNLSESPLAFARKIHKLPVFIGCA